MKRRRTVFLFPYPMWGCGVNSNFEQFSIYSGKVLEMLSSSFPIPFILNESEVIKECLKFDRDEDLKEFRYKKDMAGIVLAFEVNDDEELAFAKKIRDEMKQEIDELEEEKRRDSQVQLNVLNSSVDFLIFEGLIRRMECGGLQLTSRAFLHLNKEFINGEVRDNKEPLSRLREIFSSGADVSRDMAVGVAISVVSAALKSA